jgi:hypothetical protein
MPYVIDKVTGKRRWASPDLLGQLLDTGAATLEEGQTIFMDNGDGDIIKIHSDEYKDVVERGGRPLTSKERRNLFENLRADEFYNQPSERLRSLGLSAVEGATAGISDLIRESDVLKNQEEALRNEQDRKAREFFNAAESITGNVLGMGAGLFAGSTQVGLGARAALGAAKAATGASKMARATSMAQKALAATPAGLAGRAGRYAGDATAKALAKNIRAAGLVKNPKVTGAIVRAAPMMAQAATEDAIIGGINAAAEFDSTVDPSEFASNVLAAAIGGGAIGGGIGGALAFAPGAFGFARVIGEKTLEGAYAANKKLGHFAQKMTGDLETADAKTIKEAFEGGKFTAEQVKKAVDDANIFSIQSPEQLSAVLTRISTTGPRAVNDLFFDINNGTRKQAVDKIAKGTKGLSELKKNFDADLFQKEYISYDGDFSDIIKNKKSYYADAIGKIEPPTDLGRALSSIRKSLASTAVYNKVVDGIVDSVKASSKALRQNKFLSPITEMDPLDILRSEAGEELPSHLANNLILAYDKIRKSLYGLNLMENRQVTDPIRDYFANTLENPRLFGETSGAYKATNKVYTNYKKAKADSNKITGKEISDQQARELFDKFLEGDKEALDKVTAYQALVKATQDYTDDVLKLTNQPKEAYESTIKENIRAFNSLEGASQVSELIKIYTPSKQNTFVKEVAKGIKDLRHPSLKTTGMPAALAFLSTWALTPGAGALGALSSYAKISIAQAAARSFRSPYKQLSRSARIEELNNQARKRYNKSVKTVVSSIGRDGQFVSDALKTTSKAARAFSASLAQIAGNNIGDVEYSDNKNKALQEKAIASIQTLAGNPQFLEQKLEDSIGEVEGSAEIKAALKQQSRDTILSLNEIKPVEIVTKIDPLTGTRTISGPDYAFDKMNQFLAVAQSPLKVISAAAESKTLTREMASAFKTLHPQVYTKFVSSIQESLLGKKGSNKTKYSDRLMLSTLFDIPMEASVTAPVMTTLQAVYQEEAQPEPRPQRGLASLKSQVTNTMTPSQRAMQTT